MTKCTHKTRSFEPVTAVKIPGWYTSIHAAKRTKKTKFTAVVSTDH